MNHADFRSNQLEKPQESRFDLMRGQCHSAIERSHVGNLLFNTANIDLSRG
jgi:hypothetical protein